jgi:hypothetical protein
VWTGGIMKKNIVVTIVIIMTFMAASFLVRGDSADDFKVIKKAVKGKKITSPTWFKLEVTEKRSKKSKVKIKVPVALIDFLADCVDDDIKVKKNDCDIDLKKLMKILKKHGPMTIIEVDGDDCIVRLSFE